MKPIAVTLLPGNKRQVFWLTPKFTMSTEAPSDDIFALNLGGFFTSAPVAVSAMARPDEGKLPLGQVVVGKAQASKASRSEIMTEIPHTTVIGPERLPRTKRTDLFGLGPNYTVLHKRFWGTLKTNDLGAWHDLGGGFTSVPAAIVWPDGRIDVFATNIEHVICYKTCIGDAWTPEWKKLGGTVTSGASLVMSTPNRLDLFARGADFTLRGNHTDGRNWLGWQNHGGELASSPVSVSWGPNRIDVFAVFKDGALWHTWWDGELWNDWESLGGSYIGEPAVATSTPGNLDVFVIDEHSTKLFHHHFENDTWEHPQQLVIPAEGSVAATPTAISQQKNQLELFIPMTDNSMRLLEWDGTSWSYKFGHGNIKIPQRYRISVDYVRAVKTRSPLNDTDAAMLSIAVGNEMARIKTQWLGDVGGGVGGPETCQTNLLNFDALSVDLAEPLSVTYIVVNNGHADQENILEALRNGGNSLSLNGSSSMQEDIARGVVKFIAVNIAEATLSVPVVGSILSSIESWLLSKLTDAIFTSCDGIVAVELRAMIGRDLYSLTNKGRKKVKFIIPHKGTRSPGGCGDNSSYEVTWTIQPL